MNNPNKILKRQEFLVPPPTIGVGGRGESTSSLHLGQLECMSREITEDTLFYSLMTPVYGLGGLLFISGLKGVPIVRLYSCLFPSKPLDDMPPLLGKAKKYSISWKGDGFDQFLLPSSLQFSSVQSLCHVQLFATPWTTARQASLSITKSQSLLKLMSIGSVMPSNHLIPSHPLLLPPSIFPSIRVFSSESVLLIRWPKYWSFSFNISPSNEHPGLIFRMDWLDLLAVQGTLKSLLQHYNSKASILLCSAFFIVQLSHPYMTAGKTIALTRQTFVGRVMSLVFNILSWLVVIAFLLRSNFMTAVTICSGFGAQENSLSLFPLIVKVKVKSLSCPTLCDPMDCSLPGSSLHGILQARVNL